MNTKPPLPPPLRKKGTVTPLASVFPAEETHKASQRVLDALTDRQKQLDQLRSFVSDNTSIINLVQRLPDELHHNIMVPFGKAAFFPGKLIHTNELMVLLGEGYYAERTSKQTVDILKRREKGLEMQIEAVKALMEDLKVEASFFDTTAAESAEGLVEIREEYIEDDFSHERITPGVQMSDNINDEDKDDEEYNRILSRLAQLEKEEEEAEKVGSTNEQVHKEDLSEQVNVKGPTHDISQDLEGLSITKKDVKLSDDVQERVVESSVIAKQEVSIEKSEPSPTNSKAFSGVIVERTHNLNLNATNQKGVNQSSKPVSRFKLQRK